MVKLAEYALDLSTQITLWIGLYYKHCGQYQVIDGPGQTN